jgi:hypothetical protein
MKGRVWGDYDRIIKSWKKAESLGARYDLYATGRCIFKF